MMYFPDKDYYKMCWYATPSDLYHSSEEKIEENKVNTFEILENAYYTRTDNLPVYSKDYGGKITYTYKPTDGYTLVPGITCTYYHGYYWDTNDPEDIIDGESEGEDLLAFLDIHDNNKYYLCGLENEREEYSYKKGSVTIKNETGTLFYQTNPAYPLKEREYMGTTKADGKLYYVVYGYIE